MGGANPSMDGTPTQGERAGYVLEGSVLKGRDKCRWGAEREKACVSGSLHTRIVKPKFQHRPREAELKAKHKGDVDDRGIIAQRLMVWGCGKKTLYNLGG